MRRLRSWASAFGLLIVGMALGLSIVKDPSPKPQAVVPASQSLGIVPDGGVIDESPDGSANATAPSEVADEQHSPEPAAIRFLEMTEDVVQLSPEAGAEMQRSIASKDASERLVTEVSEAPGRCTRRCCRPPGPAQSQVSRDVDRLGRVDLVRRGHRVRRSVGGRVVAHCHLLVGGRGRHVADG